MNLKKVLWPLAALVLGVVFLAAQNVKAEAFRNGDWLCAPKQEMLDIAKGNKQIPMLSFTNNAGDTWVFLANEDRYWVILSPSDDDDGLYCLHPDNIGRDFTLGEVEEDKGT